jgi:hypothetical protein
VINEMNAGNGLTLLRQPWSGRPGPQDRGPHVDPSGRMGVFLAQPWHRRASMDHVSGGAQRPPTNWNQEIMASDLRLHRPLAFVGVR